MYYINNDRTWNNRLWYTHYSTASCSSIVANMLMFLPHFIPGVDSADITATLKYNHIKNTVSTEFNIPDYDIEAGIKFALTGSDPRTPGMRGITIDVTNKNIPQLSLIARTR